MSCWKQLVVAYWLKIPIYYIQDLNKSIPKRLKQVIKAKRCITKYGPNKVINITVNNCQSLWCSPRSSNLHEHHDLDSGMVESILRRVVAKWVHVDGNIDNFVWSVIARHFPDDNYLFQDDNAPIHRARVVKEYMEETDQYK
jgi:hypothetical protein